MGKEFAIVVASMIGTIVGLASLAIWLQSAGCEARWANSGTPAKYTAVGGCLVTAGNRVLSEEAYIAERTAAAGLGATAP